MSASENRKDELAARALSRLPDPPLPEGLAARIAARATAVPQIGSIAPPLSQVVVPLPVEAVVPAEPARPALRRWPFYAAASAAAVLLPVGILAGMNGREESKPALAEEKNVAPLPRSQQQAPAELVDAAPRPAEAAQPAEKSLPAAAPKMILPIPAAPPPTELASEEKPAETAKPVEDVSQPERLAQTGPQAGPQGTSPGSPILVPVYGPPAPTGLGIAGSVGGATSFPGEAERAPRSAPMGPPPSSLPGPSTPRGPGPRR
ncbi:hypothetical protein FHR22_002246 [Sphingopyxis panaciterrae]|uniref:hypothetical protein n=1 Tax=Sphingopyxis panaciterrae TaxID=363841 RepID=UPI001423A989|nr:hypothetical protein [Sphingopyxis panaciterrae]NIJ37562.1 hypothetical protein [Sphingopyxis panaciterrae]